MRHAGQVCSERETKQRQSTKNEDEKKVSPKKERRKITFFVFRFFGAENHEHGWRHLPTHITYTHARNFNGIEQVAW